MGPALIHDYGIIGNGRSAALVGPVRIDRLALLAALRQPVAARRAAGRDARRALLDRAHRAVHGDARVRGTNRTSSSPPSPPPTARSAYRSDAGDVRGGQGDDPLPRARDPARVRVRARRASSCASSSIPVRTTRAAPFRSAPRATSAFGSRTARRLYTLRADRPLAQIGPDRRRGPLHAARRRARDVLAGVRPRGARGAATAGSRGHHRRSAPRRGGGSWAARCTYDGPYRHAVDPQRAGAQAAQLRAVGRDRGGADDVAARADRRRSQLGLPLLLDPRRGADGHARCPISATRTKRRRSSTGCCTARG